MKDPKIFCADCGHEWTMHQENKPSLDPKRPEGGYTCVEQVVNEDAAACDPKWIQCGCVRKPPGEKTQ